MRCHSNPRLKSIMLEIVGDPMPSGHQLRRLYEHVKV